jgi:recombination protein RecA
LKAITGTIPLETHFSRAARSHLLTPGQHDFITGSLLGDATLLRTTAGWSFRVHHGLEQSWYVDYKYDFIKELVRSQPSRSGQGYYFRTITHPQLAEYRIRFYDRARKIVPIDLLERRLSTRGLAIWFMDDGGADGSGARLNTQSFSYDENRALAAFLERRFGLCVTINQDKGKARLRFGSQARTRLASLIGPLIHPNMLYKLSTAPKRRGRPNISV